MSSNANSNVTNDDKPTRRDSLVLSFLLLSGDTSINKK